MTTDADDLLEVAARHEAGHAVARWFCVGRRRRWPATRLTVNVDGSGYTAGTRNRIGVTDTLRVTLAGPAAEAGLGLLRGGLDTLPLRGLRQGT